MSIYSAVVLVVLWAGSVGLAKDATTEKDTKQKPTTAQKETPDAKKATTPQQKKIEDAKKAFETEMASWKDVRKMAQGEKASKTVAAIDKIIKAREDGFKKELAQLEKQATDKATGDTAAKTGDATKAASKPTSK
jgi:hypothetical protein